MLHNEKNNHLLGFKNAKRSVALFFLLSVFFFFKTSMLGVTFTVTNTSDAGAGSFRQAITDANSTVGNDNIIFNLGPGGPFTITLLSSLPNLTDNSGVTIDGWNNSGNNGTPNTVAVFSTSIATPLNPVYKIVLGNGANIPVGLNVNSTNNLIKGLVLQNFGDGTPSNNDIAISIAAANNTILGCYIGMDATGTISGTLTNIGIRITAQNNRIGDGTTAGVNLISGLYGSGNKIYLSGGTATANIIRGNLIGLQANGTSIATGTSSGINLVSSANSNTIGGTNSGDGNLISGNPYTGIVVSTNSNVIQGNYIGPLGDGVSGLVGTQQSNGLSMGGSYNLLGGSVAGARNLISGNTNLGMDMSGSYNRIQGNYWGTTKTGLAKLSASNNSGMALNSGITNTVGGSNPGEGNVISGVPGMAIWMLYNVGAVTNCIQQNTIGIAANGTSSLTGGGNGIGIWMMLNTANNVIGGSTSNTRNVISGSGTGIYLSSNCGGGNLIKGNYLGLAGDGINRVTGASQSYGISVNSVSITTNAPNVIGGTGAGEGNVISGNGSYGIYISTTTSSLTAILQNTIGPQANGTSTLVGGTTQAGIYIDGAITTTIGGSTGASSRNIISSNSGFGIGLNGATATANIVSGNYIGPGSSGAAITGAAQATGIQIQASANTNTVGGYLGGFGLNPQANLISYNTGNGINITSTGSSSNLIARNLIYLNGGAFKPINLNYGVNQGNGGKAVPVIMTVTNTAVTGSAAATAGVGDTVEVFTNTTGNCRDMMAYKGSTLATAAGNWTLSGITVNLGESVVATARTIINNNTSEASICTVPLPVELLNFNATCNEDKKVNLKWATASQHNCERFEIERSDDGVNFISIGKIKGAGNDMATINYSYVDPIPAARISYYRLKQTDFDKSSRYYNNVFIADCYLQQTNVVVYPNPTSDDISLKFSSPVNQQVSIEILDVLGKSMFKQDLLPVSGTSVFDIKTYDLPKGIYFLKAVLPGATEQIKFLKN